MAKAHGDIRVVSCELELRVAVVVGVVRETEVLAEGVRLAIWQ